MPPVRAAGGGVFILLAGLEAQSGAATAGRGAAPATGRAAAPAVKAPPANLLQLVRGTLYPASNVIFAAQGTDPDKVPPDADPSTALNPLASPYGKWPAGEKASPALA